MPCSNGPSSSQWRVYSGGGAGGDAPVRGTEKIFLNASENKSSDTTEKNSLQFRSRRLLVMFNSYFEGS